MTGREIEGGTTAPDEPMERAGSLVRLREATLDDAEVVDARARDPAMIGEFNDFGLGKPKPLAENLANGKRMVGPIGERCSSCGSRTTPSSATSAGTPSHMGLPPARER